MFYDQLINIYTCECGAETYSFQKILDFPLLLPLGNAEYSLSSKINNNFKDIVYDWKEICNGCKINNIKYNKNIFYLKLIYLSINLKL